MTCNNCNRSHVGLSVLKDSSSLHPSHRRRHRHRHRHDHHGRSSYWCWLILLFVIVGMINAFHHNTFKLRKNILSTENKLIGYDKNPFEYINDNHNDNNNNNSKYLMNDKARRSLTRLNVMSIRRIFSSNKNDNSNKGSKSNKDKRNDNDEAEKNLSNSIKTVNGSNNDEVKGTTTTTTTTTTMTTERSKTNKFNGKNRQGNNNNIHNHNRTKSPLFSDVKHDDDENDEFKNSSIDDSTTKEEENNQTTTTFLRDELENNIMEEPTNSYNNDTGRNQSTIGENKRQQPSQSQSPAVPGNKYSVSSSPLWDLPSSLASWSLNIPNTTTNAFKLPNVTSVNTWNSRKQSAGGGTTNVGGSGGMPRPPPQVLLIPRNRSLDDTITVADLEEILRTNAFLRQGDLSTLFLPKTMDGGTQSIMTTPKMTSSSARPSQQQQQQQSWIDESSSVGDGAMTNDGSIPYTIPRSTTSAIPPSYTSNNDDVGSNRMGIPTNRNQISARGAATAGVGSSSSSPATTTATTTFGPSRRRTTRSGVAFPQPNVLSFQSLQRGTAIAGGVAGMIVSTTILPNLWLIGIIFGGIYGSNVAKNWSEQMAKETDDDDDDDDDDISMSFVARTLLQIGRRLAKSALQVLDWWQTIWFLYKTGQLSYEYYKTYAALDQRFAIQAKMDSWNARFQEGKVKFDAWEKENEIGRTILAGLRTAWLVDEQAKQRRKRSGGGRQTSRYRIIQSLYDARYWVGKSVRRFYKNWFVPIFFGTEDGSPSSLKEFITGISTDLQFSSSGGGGVGLFDIWQARVGAIIASLILINVIGALFTISPTFITLMAIMAGIVWPSWVAELFLRVQDLIDEIRERGRIINDGSGSSGSTGDGPSSSSSSSSTSTTRSRRSSSSSSKSTRSSRINTAKLIGRYDKQKYHYYKRPDGTKRYYRTGQQLLQQQRNVFGRFDNDGNGSTSSSTNGSRKQQRQRQDGRNRNRRRNNNMNFLSDVSWPNNPKSRKKISRRPGKEQWGLFSR